MKSSRPLIQLRRLNAAHPEDISELQKVLESAPTYQQRIHNRPVEPNSAVETLRTLPEAISHSDKFVFGIFCADSRCPNGRDDQLVGYVEVIRGHPDPETATLGGMLISEPHQRSGIGSVTYEAVENIIRSWPEIRRIRGGVIGGNSEVLSFWESLGFTAVAAHRPMASADPSHENLLLEKSLRKPREHVRSRRQPQLARPDAESP